MRKMLIAVAALAATGGPAMAETKPQNGWLTLSAPTTQDHIVFDGAVWRCKADVCRSTKVKSLPPLRSCKRLARELGTITGFRYRGHLFTDDAGRYRFRTILPALYPGRTRHYHVKVQAPQQPVLTTQLYFPDEPGNSRDGLFRRELVMRMAEAGDGLSAQFAFVLDLR